MEDLAEAGHVLEDVVAVHRRVETIVGVEFGHDRLRQRAAAVGLLPGNEPALAREGGGHLGRAPLDAPLEHAGNVEAPGDAFTSAINERAPVRDPPIDNRKRDITEVCEVLAIDFAQWVWSGQT